MYEFSDSPNRTSNKFSRVSHLKQNSAAYHPDHYGSPSHCKLTNSVDKIHVRCLIPSRIAGSIIGKGGSSIKKLRSEYEVNIVIPESNNPERVILISHRLEDNSDDTYKTLLRKCCEAIRRVAEILQEAEVRFAGGNLKTLKDQLNIEDGPNVDVRVLMNESVAKHLQNDVDEIDRNFIERAMAYSNIKEIRIFDDKCPNSTDHIVKMVGQPEQIKDCVYFMMDNTFKLYRNLIENGIWEKHYNTVDADLARSDLYGGFNENNNQTADLRDLGKAALNTQAGTSSVVFAVTDEVIKSGQDSNFNSLKDSVVFRKGPPSIAPNFDSVPTNSSNINGMYESMPRLQDSQDYNTDLSKIVPPNVDEHKACICIPNSMAFHLIGVDGSRLKEIEKDAAIPIIMNTPIGTERIIHIGPGTQSQIYDAQYLLRRCLEDEAFAAMYDQPVQSLELIAQELIPGVTAAIDFSNSNLGKISDQIPHTLSAFDPSLMNEVSLEPTTTVNQNVLDNVGMISGLACEIAGRAAISMAEQKWSEEDKMNVDKEIKQEAES